MAKITTICVMKISLWSRFLDLIAPRLCCVCGNRLAITENTVCSVCVMHLPRTAIRDFQNNPMAQMFWGLAPVERAAALFYYHVNSNTSNILYELKYRNRPEIGLDMGRLMASELMIAGFFDGMDVIVPLPLSRQRKRTRGYNQSEMLAKGIGEITGIPCETKAVGRKYFKKSQTRVNRYERRGNVEDAFMLLNAECLRGKHVLLVDDVVTTGSTMIACAETMKNIEGIRISYLALALTKN